MMSCIAPRKAEYEKGELILQAADSLREIGVVLAGTVEICKETPLGERVVLTKIPAGGIFGEVVALVGAQKAPVTIFSSEKSTILYFQPEKLLTPCRSVCSWHRQLTLNLVRLLAQKALYLNRKIDYLVIKSMRGKLSTFLYEQYRKSGKHQFILPFNRNDLADFLNVSRPSMSRELGRMRDEGILTFSGSSFKIENLPLLQRYVE